MSPNRSQSDIEYWERGLEQAKNELADLVTAVEQGLIKTDKEFEDLVPSAIRSREETITIYTKGLEIAKLRRGSGDE